MSNGLTQIDDSTGNYVKDPVMQETPVADRFISPKEAPHGSSAIGNQSKSTEDTKQYPNVRVEETGTGYLSSPLVDEDREVNIFSKEPMRDDNEPFLQSLPKFNRRTPDLDKIAEFFHNNRTPRQSKFLAQIESSVIHDTPECQRRNPSHNMVKANKMSSSTEFIIAPRKEEEEESFFEVTEADARFKMDASRSEKSIEMAEDGEPSGKLRFFADESQFQKQKKQLEEAKITEANESIIDTNGTPNSTTDEFLEKSCKGATFSHNDPDVSHNDVANKESDTEVSRVNDTTDGDLSAQWVFRPHNHGPSNSSKSTQIIDTMEAQEETSTTANVGARKNEAAKPGHMNDTQTQLVASFNLQEISFVQKGRALDSSTQVLRSPERTLPNNTQDTPSTSINIFFEPIMEVPETSSPPKSKEIIDIASSASSSISEVPEILRKNIEQENDSQEKVFLQISSRPDHFASQENDQTPNPDSNKELTSVMTEAELTQDLPEVEEQGTQENKRSTSYRNCDSSFEDSQEITKQASEKRRKNKHVIIEEEVDEGYRKHPRKKLRRSIPFDSDSNQTRTPTRSLQLDEEISRSSDPHLQSDRVLNEWPLEEREDFPKDIKKQDEKYLSKKDIKVEDAVWCQYDLNYSFYPGRLLSYDENLDECWVVFDTGKSLTKNDDIYYLDIRVGDTVNWNGKAHVVIALECKTQRQNVIRCIRGYDTVHLKKKNVSANLGKRSFIVPLSSISLDVNEWTKRPKIILEEGSHTRAKAFKFLRHPIRGRKNVATISPRKARTDLESANRLTYKEESDEDSCEGNVSNTADQILELFSKSESPKVKRKLCKARDSKIFNNCVFVLSGLNQDKNELPRMIESFGGTVIELGFLELFKYEYLENHDQQLGDEYVLNLDWKSSLGSDFGSFRFACLLSEKHLRSLKYLEALALGWPTLHWKFVEECLKTGKLCTEKLHQYLLPSGESYRLNMDSREKSGVIKSSNIFYFYSKLLRGNTLNDQMGSKKYILSDYTILIYGHSELDQFIRFVFACFGVKKIFQFAGKIGNPGLNHLDVLTKRINFFLAEKKNRKMIIYINGDNGLSSTVLEETRQKVWKCFTLWENLPADFHVESKEWLIQTIINEDTEFGEAFDSQQVE